MYVVKIACERPDDVGRSLSQWDCTEIARQLVRAGVVTSISAETVRQILLHHRLEPWRQKMWLSPKVPRDAAFATQVQAICDLYTRPLRPDEVVLCIDEMTSLQPRPRRSPTRAPGLSRWPAVLRTGPWAWRPALVDSVPAHFIMHRHKAAPPVASICTKFRLFLDFRSPMRHIPWPVV